MNPEYILFLRNLTRTFI